MHGDHAESCLNTKVEENVEAQVGLYADDCKAPLPPKKHRSVVCTKLSTGACETVPTEEWCDERVRTDVNDESCDCETANEEENSLLDNCSHASVQSSPECDSSEGLSLNTDIGCGSADKLSLIETYDNVSETGESTEVTPLTEKALDKSSDCEAGHIEIYDCQSQAESPWVRMLEEHVDRRAREAVIAFGQQNPHEESSPFGYKAWLMRLSHRRRFEILITIALFLWLAFFIVLAIFMNGPSAKNEDSDVTTDQSENSNLLPIARNQSIAINTTSLFGLNNWTSAHIPSTSLPIVTIPVEVVSTTSFKDYTTTSSTLESKVLADSQTSTALPSRPTSMPLAKTQVTQESAREKLPTSLPVTETLKVAEKKTLEKIVTATARGQSSPSTTTLVKIVNSTKSTATIKSFKSSAQSSFSATDHTSQRVIQAENVDKRPTTQPKNQGSAQIFDEFLEEAEKNPTVAQLVKDKTPNYRIGIARADITGPAADVNMMGYANPSQTAGGVHIRQYARAFIVSQGDTRIVFVNIDACMGSKLVKLEVLKELQKLYGNLYNAGNLCISGTHTHSAPAGYLQDVLFQITSMGYVPETLKAMVEGIVESIRLAHNKIAPGYILMNKGELLDSNINRSPLAYLNNPISERNRYKYDVDKDMILLKFLDAKGKGIGMLNWFAVHCTSMNYTNTLISGDNKGYAELLFEQAMDSEALVGQSSFVAAFAQSNEGDVSPNTKGPHCIDTGLPCDNIESTCNGKVQNCIASGPGKDMFESTEIIAKNQFRKALELYDSASALLTGPVQAVQQYVDMTNQRVRINKTFTGRTCQPAMGFSFAAGTTDGPGAFNFKQGDKSGNTFWKIVRNFLHSPSKEQAACQYPKPILVDTGEMKYPYLWQPKVVDTQIFRIGRLIISAVPGEFTTMSGRRLNDAVAEAFTKSNSTEEFECVIAGLSNTYSDYITTYEEYHVQRYEGASTIYGPHTLSAYIQQYKKLARAMLNKRVPSGDIKVSSSLSKLMSLVPGVVMDSTPFGGYEFGDALVDAKESYNKGDVVSVQFVSANPRNSPSTNMTFLTIEKKVNNTWKVIRTDADWDTKYIWERSSTLGSVRGLSEATIKWDTSSLTSSGYYHINHFGHYKSFWSRHIYAFEGTSKTFYISANDTLS